MSSKRKWDQAAPDDEGPASKAVKQEDSKSASEAATAAAAAAAIAAKIAAQFASGGGGGGAIGGSFGGAGKDQYDGAFTQDIDINDMRNRYLLTKSSTQDQIHEETGASVATKGVWYPDRSRATDKDPPLYLHISAATKEQLDSAVLKINELIDLDMGSLVEDKTDQRKMRRKWPEEKLPVNLESLRNFNVRAKVVGPSGQFVKYIQQETQTRVQIKGVGSGFIEQETGRESDEPMHIHLTGPDEGQVARAKVLTEDLLEVVHAEHAKAKAVMTQQQMELHQAQAAYAAYANSFTGYGAQQPPGPAPPPPPSDAPPPPPGAPPSAPDGSQAAGSMSAQTAPSSNDADAYAQYWAAYGYDVNSPEFKQWQAAQQQQYAEYYAQQGYGGSGASPPPPGGTAQQPPPPPSNDAPPPPPPS